MCKLSFESKSKSVALLPCNAHIAFNFFCTTSSMNLTWRDMQHLVVRTSRPAHLITNDWRTNGVGRLGKWQFTWPINLFIYSLDMSDLVTFSISLSLSMWQWAILMATVCWMQVPWSLWLRTGPALGRSTNVSLICWPSPGNDSQTPHAAQAMHQYTR